MTCQANRTHSSFQLPMVIDFRASPAHVQMWQVRSRERRLNERYSERWSVSLTGNGEKNAVGRSQTPSWKIIQKGEPRRGACCRCYCSLDHNVQCVTVKNVSPRMHQICEVLSKRVKVCVFVYWWEKAVSRSTWWICFCGKQGAASSMPSVNSHSLRVVTVCGWWYR